MSFVLRAVQIMPICDNIARASDERWFRQQWCPSLVPAGQVVVCNGFSGGRGLPCKIRERDGEMLGRNHNDSRWLKNGHGGCIASSEKET